MLLSRIKYINYLINHCSGRTQSAVYCGHRMCSKSTVLELDNLWSLGMVIYGLHRSVVDDLFQ